MNTNREILKHCPHFYTIINFEYYSDDVISEKLIDFYEKYIFSCDLSSSENVYKVEQLDKTLYKYISDNAFRMQIKKDIENINIKNSDNLIDSIVTFIINSLYNYEKTKYKRVQMTRWI